MSAIERLIERVSDATGNQWDAGTQQNAALAERLAVLLPALAGLSAGARASIVATFVEDAMNLDADDRLMEELGELVREEMGEWE